MGRRLVLAGSAAGILAIILSLAIAVIAAQSASAGQRGNNAAPPTTPPCGPNLPIDIKNVAKDSRCFELRIYTVREGSSADLLHSRFRDHTTALFKKHGMTIVGFWQPVTKRGLHAGVQGCGSPRCGLGCFPVRSGVGENAKRHAGERAG